MSATAFSYPPQTPLPSLHAGFESVLVSQLGRETKDWAGRSRAGWPAEPLNFARLLEMVDDDPLQLRELVTLYLRESTRGLGELLASIQSGDREQTERLAHRLGGTAAMCGMVGLVAPLRAIEIAAQSGRWSRMGLLMLEARRQHGRVVDCLERHGLGRDVSMARTQEAGR